MSLKNNMPGDMGNTACIINVKKQTLSNYHFRKAIWTGDNLQVTVMSIPSGGEIGIEIHDDVDQFLKVEYGIASVYMGKTKQDVKFVGNANSNYAILIPAGTVHNIINEQKTPLKLYSVYAPPKHPIGTIHKTKFEADLDEE